MNLKEYIESGILELYAMGSLPDDEAGRVAEDIAAHPELRAELEEISRVLEMIAPVEGVEPSGELRGRVMEAIAGTGTAAPENTPSSSTASNVVPLVAPAETVQSEEVESTRNYLLAASFIGLLIAATAALWFGMKYGDAKEQLAVAQTQQGELAMDLERVRKELTTLRNHDNRIVRMASTNNPDIPNAFAIVYWNAESQTVWIDAAAMPPLPTGKQYQLWALDDGNPIDAGVFNGDTTDLQKLKEVTGAQAFAVTVEPEGGSESPTLETMAVMGELANS